MADQGATIGAIRSEIQESVKLVEQAQAIAARAVQRYNKLGGAAFLVDYVWPAELSEADFIAAVGSLGTLFPDIMGNHGTNLYKAF
jgi:hypothetical protein